MKRFKLHVYAILYRKCWHYSNSFDTIDDVFYFLHWHKMNIFDERLVHRLYRIHDNLTNTDNYIIVDYTKLSYRTNNVKYVSKDSAYAYIMGI